MSDVQAAVETIQRAAKRHEPCPVQHYGVPCGRVVKPYAKPGEGWPRPCFPAHIYSPLADTPEGDHEFMEIIRWGEKVFGPAYSPEGFKETMLKALAEKAEVLRGE